MQKYTSQLPLEAQNLLLQIISEAEPLSETSLISGIIQASKEHPELLPLLQKGSAIRKPDSLLGDVTTTSLESMLSFLRIQGIITMDRDRVAFTYLARLSLGKFKSNDYVPIVSKVRGYMN